ncbi:unnamed protein product, partial [Candidula unifasciata]
KAKEEKERVQKAKAELRLERKKKEEEKGDEEGVEDQTPEKHSKRERKKKKFDGFVLAKKDADKSQSEDKQKPASEEDKKRTSRRSSVKKDDVKKEKTDLDEEESTTTKKDKKESESRATRKERKDEEAKAGEKQKKRVNEDDEEEDANIKEEQQEEEDDTLEGKVKDEPKATENSDSKNNEKKSQTAAEAAEKPDAGLRKHSKEHKSSSEHKTGHNHRSDEARNKDEKKRTHSEESKRRKDDDKHKSHSDKERKKQEKLEQKKQEKLEQKKKEKKEQITLSLAENTLIQMDTEIKKALNIESLDIDKCVAILEDLAAMPVNPLLLRKNPAIMATIKKCRKFKKSIAIQQKAEVIYHKFKSIFLAEGAAGKNPEPTSKLRENKENEISSGESAGNISSLTPPATNASTNINGDVSDSSPAPAGAVPTTPADSISASGNSLVATDSTSITHVTKGTESEITASANVAISESSAEASTVGASHPSDSTVKEASSSPSRPKSSLEASLGDHSEVAVPKDLDTSLSSQRVDESFIFQNVNTGGISTSSFIPGLDAVFKEGVDYRNSQTFKSDASNSDLGVDHLGAETDNSTVKNVSDNSDSLFSKDKGSTKETTSYDPRRPLSLPLPPAVGDEDMEEDEEFNNNDSVAEDKVDRAVEVVSPIIPLMDSSVAAEITNMVSDAVR